MTNKTDLILILAVLGVAVFILAKSGIFKLANTASDLADTAVEGVNRVATDIINLPENLAYITNPETGINIIKSAGTQLEAITGWDIPDVLTLGAGNPRENYTPYLLGMVNQAKAIFPDMTDANAIYAMMGAGYKWDKASQVWLDQSGNPLF
jgi:hypothetical protein